MILAGDIGGTNTRLALFNDSAKLVAGPVKFSTGDGKQFEQQARETIGTWGKPVEQACIAVAGPVIEGVCHATNFGRTFVDHESRDAIGLQKLTLINDLVANASGIELLAADMIVTLCAGGPHIGSRAVCSPGTGLGEGLLIYDGHRHRAFPAEGGHSRFAPNSADERGLLDYLTAKFGDVIVEHVLCGRGIGRTFDYYVSTGRKPAQAVLDALAKVAPEARAGVISAAAIDKSCDVCVSVMELFVHALAVECSSLAVKSFAIGGIFVGGGIPPKIRPLLETALFRDAFVKHPTMNAFLKNVPVKLILNDDTALEGAALYGLRFG